MTLSLDKQKLDNLASEIWKSAKRVCTDPLYPKAMWIDW
jgi:hypothetical protein